MRILGKIIAFFILLILLVALPVSILAYDIGRVVFDQILVKDIITDIVTDSDLIPAALKWYSEQRAEQRYGAGEAIAWEDEPDIVDLLSMVSTESWREIRAEALPDEILIEWISVAVDGTYQWIDSEDRVPDVTLDLLAFKERVNSEHGENAIRVVYESLPPCTEDEIADFRSRLAASLPGEEVLYNLCQFPDPWASDQVSDYHNSLIFVVENIPDTFALTQELSHLEDTRGIGPELIKAQLLLVRQSMRLAPLIPVVLLVLILLLAIRSLKELGNWWGIPLSLDGALLLVLALIYPATLVGVLTIGPLSEIPPLVREEALSALMILANAILDPLMWQSIIVLALGLILIVVGVAVWPKPAAEVAPVTE